MPLYEFKCEDGHMWEINVPIAERDNPQQCEDCGGYGTRLYFPLTVQFNAKDFYSTDNPKM